jgi:hypothetical protein
MTRLSPLRSLKRPEPEGSGAVGAAYTRLRMSLARRTARQRWIVNGLLGAMVVGLGALGFATLDKQAPALADRPQGNHVTTGTPSVSPTAPASATASASPTATASPAPSTSAPQSPTASPSAPASPSTSTEPSPAPSAPTKPTPSPAATSQPATRTVISLAPVYGNRAGTQKTYARCPVGWIAVDGSAKVVSAKAKGTATLTDSYLNAGDPGQWVAEWTVPPDPSGARTVRTSVTCQQGTYAP